LPSSSRSRWRAPSPRPTSWSPPPPASGATLAVGQTERYNPAVQAVLPLVTAPRFIEVHRLGVFPDRSLDIDVVFDLMIHDLDIVLALVARR
jgi:predicted dehydrogenase